MSFSVLFSLFSLLVVWTKQKIKTVDGDSRYAKAKFKHIKTTNALKMWSNKEYRNLIRMHRAGIPCPVPLYQTDHTLVMSMVTKYSSRRSGVRGDCFVCVSLCVFLCVCFFVCVSLCVFRSCVSFLCFFVCVSFLCFFPVFLSCVSFLYGVACQRLVCLVLGLIILRFICDYSAIILLFYYSIIL